jgi:hypothetical protein
MNSRHSLIPGAAIIAGCIGVLVGTSAQGAITANYTPGDLILGIQSSTNTAVVIEVNIGANLQYKNSTSSFLIGNIGTQLGNSFTATWYDSPNLFFGISGVNNNLSLSAGTADANGDFNSTIYASRARSSNGSVGLANSTAWSFSASTVTTAASPMLQQAGTFDQNDVQRHRHYHHQHRQRVVGFQSGQRGDTESRLLERLYRGHSGPLRYGRF